jgi:hypothetical protein
MEFNSARLAHEKSENGKDEPFYAEKVKTKEFEKLPHAKTKEFSDKVSRRTYFCL